MRGDSVCWMVGQRAAERVGQRAHRMAATMADWWETWGETRVDLRAPRKVGKTAVQKDHWWVSPMAVHWASRWARQTAVSWAALTVEQWAEKWVLQKAVMRVDPSGCWMGDWMAERSGSLVESWVARSAVNSVAMMD